ncbi:hypothetical protein BBJ28_00012259 [Nothophytophthora sp. Chile5]|nr:hypothetical protein BBJ28_00012259 [Nothophytophthora sp. Chile5]
MQQGLSPEEITQCLKSVERHNGLSQLAQRTAQHLAADINGRNMTVPSDAATASSSPLSRFALLMQVIKRYGAVTLVLAVLGYSYLRFRRRMAEQLAIKQEGECVQRKTRMNGQVEALLSVVREQQTQYDQSLQAELLQLKGVVVDTYLHPPVAKAVDGGKAQPIVLHAGAPTSMISNVANAAVRSNVTSQATHLVTSKVKQSVVASSIVVHKGPATSTAKLEDTEKKETVLSRNQTTLSSAEMKELLKNSQADEELSTARSYRMLFATQ